MSRTWSNKAVGFDRFDVPETKPSWHCQKCWRLNARNPETTASKVQMLFPRWNWICFDTAHTQIAWNIEKFQSSRKQCDAMFAIFVVALRIVFFSFSFSWKFSVGTAVRAHATRHNRAPYLINYITILHRWLLAIVIGSSKQKSNALQTS